MGSDLPRGQRRRQPSCERFGPVVAERHGHQGHVCIGGPLQGLRCDRHLWWVVGGELPEGSREPEGEALGLGAVVSACR